MGPKKKGGGKKKVGKKTGGSKGKKKLHRVTRFSWPSFPVMVTLMYGFHPAIHFLFTLM